MIFQRKFNGNIRAYLQKGGVLTKWGFKQFIQTS